jgi:hypothetical protein
VIAAASQGGSEPGVALAVEVRQYFGGSAFVTSKCALTGMFFCHLFMEKTNAPAEATGIITPPGQMMVQMEEVQPYF